LIIDHGIGDVYQHDVSYLTGIQSVFLSVAGIAVAFDISPWRKTQEAGATWQGRQEAADSWSVCQAAADSWVKRQESE
jgi:hypothetical protein